MFKLLKSARGETNMTTIIVVGGLIFVVTVMIAMAGAMKLDDVAQEAALTICSDFINTCANEGKITRESYNKFLDDLHGTNYSYDHEIKVQHLDENIGNKTAWTSSSVIGENKYVTVYTPQIKSDIDSIGKYLMKEGDIITVSVENTNLSPSQQLKNGIYTAIGKGSAVVNASGSATVKVNGK